MRLLHTLAVTAACLLGGVARADGVTVDVDLVRATRGDAHIDDALQDIAADLKSLPFTHFDRVGGSTWTTGVGEPKIVDLPGGVRVVATVMTASADKASVLVDVFRNGSQLAHTMLERPYARAGVLSVGKDGEATYVLPVTVRR